jgi:hypothetical protein
MTKTLYAHMNNKKKRHTNQLKKNNKKKKSWKRIVKEISHTIKKKKRIN